MASILLVAHAPLATALKALAGHAYAECSPDVTAVDEPPSASLDEAADLVSKALAAVASGEALILTDVFGATPCNAAHGWSTAVSPAGGRRQRTDGLAGNFIPGLADRSTRRPCRRRSRPGGAAGRSSSPQNQTSTPSE